MIAGGKASKNLAEEVIRLGHFSPSDEIIFAQGDVRDGCMARREARK
jgi:hypothetical protein